MRKWFADETSAWIDSFTGIIALTTGLQKDNLPRPMSISRLFLPCMALVTTIATPSLLAEEPQAPALPDGLYAVWETPRGTITAELYFTKVPLGVATFAGLAEGTIPVSGQPAGHKFYDGLVFHRVVPGFVVQGGDPLGTGEGDAGFKFADEFSPQLKHDAAGVLALANSGPNTNSCQFYFTLAPVNRLNYKHTVFGHVVRGLDVLPNIVKGDAMRRVTIVRVGAQAEAFRPDAAMIARLRETTPVIAPRDPARPKPFVESAGIGVPAAKASWLDEKLHHYAAVNGIEVWVRILARNPAPDPTTGSLEIPEEVMGKLVGTNRRAAVLALFGDDPHWRLWLGEALLERFDLPPGSSYTSAGMAKLAKVRAAILAPAMKELETNGPRYSVDAAITGLIEALDRADDILQAIAPPGSTPAAPAEN
jgi:cyclophilin family peptidyl-prolyl cis-trans isomerase